jgi:high-affinity K+ transport system ATPase subunit B
VDRLIVEGNDAVYDSSITGELCLKRYFRGGLCMLKSDQVKIKFKLAEDSTAITRIIMIIEDTQNRGAYI